MAVTRRRMILLSAAICAFELEANAGPPTPSSHSSAFPPTSDVKGPRKLTTIKESVKYATITGPGSSTGSSSNDTSASTRALTERIVITGFDVLICGAAVFTVFGGAPIPVAQALSIVVVAQCIPNLESDVMPLAAMKAVHTATSLMIPSTFAAGVIVTAIFGPKYFILGTELDALVIEPSLGLFFSTSEPDLIGFASAAYGVFPEVRSLTREIMEKPGMGEVQKPALPQRTAPQRTDAPNSPELERGPLLA